MTTLIDVETFETDTLNPTSMADERSERLLEGLNEEQKQAVEATEGPVLVLAGAGTGKTRVLTTRIAYILERGLAFPSQILGVTFTNKAAREMKERIEKMVGPEQTQGLWLGTFHSLCVRILRRHAALLDLPDNFTILDADDQIRLIKQLLKEYEVDDKRWPAKAFAAMIQRFKDRAKTPEDLKTDDMHFGGDKGMFQTIYEAYQRQLRLLGAVDFGDLILHSITLFQKNPDILQEYQRRFRYVLVDEYQDTNVAQYLWLRLLSQGHKNICCVGDDDQSIYGWRGAEVGNILRFEKDFQGAEVIRLERNYRSTSHILGAASHLIANNKGRLGKTLWTEGSTGEKVQLVSVWDEQAEARFIAEEIESLQQIHSVSLNNIAILVRAGFQTRAFEEVFVSMGISYHIVGGLKFYERQEIRDAVAYIRATFFATDDLAYERIINLPKRGIGPATIDQIRTHARENQISMQDATRNLLATKAFKPKVASALGKLIDQFDSWRNMAAMTPHADMVQMMLEESGYLPMWKNDKAPEAPGRVDNLKELITAIEEFETIDHFLEHIALVMDVDESNNGEFATVMSMHAAKGLEYDHVFLSGWEEGLFPSQRSMDEKAIEGLEEERRLAYVGMTRAKKKLTISFAANRRIYNQWQSSIPSRFIDELPEGDIDRINHSRGPGYQGGDSRYVDKSVYANQNTAKVENKSKYSAAGGLQPGQRVFHIKFGYGKINDISGEHVLVSFEKAGKKTVLKDYLEKV